MEILSTRTSIEDFKESLLWKDIQAELEDWRKGFKEEAVAIVDEAAENNPSTAAVLMHLGDLNGRLKAVDYFLSLPDVFISILKQKQEEKDDSGR